MSLTPSKSAFVTRFDRIWIQARRVQLVQALCWAVLTTLAGIALVAAVDYYWELPYELRLGAIIATGSAALAIAAFLAVRSVRRWRRQATAATIEQVFPQLGQRIRTTVQFGSLSSGEVTQAGVASTLLSALEEDTLRRADPLPLDAVIPWRPLAFTSLLAATVSLGLAGGSAVDWQWRAAAHRAFLGNDPYTRITVSPGDLTVKDGESAKVEITVEGRTSKTVSLWTRRLGGRGGEWQEQQLAPEDSQPTGERQVSYAVPLHRIAHPLEYRASAGAAMSDTYRITVLYPLNVLKVQSTIVSPEYTGLPEAVTESGNITALAGSQWKLQVELDRPPQTAWLELQQLNRRAGEPAPTVKVPLAIDGAKLTASMPITTDQSYRIVAKAADGMELPERRFRIRVRQDAPPQVVFESPSEALEVHTLAEVLMRLRVTDDFGLSRAGIVFQVNNEEEYPLLAENFLGATTELQTTGRLTPQTRASLERALPLEHFELTERDCVMYYAFAEDNRPGGVQRTDSDLRFIDIRPFRRRYRLVDLGAGNGGGGPQFKSLEEIIARQRYALNRTIQVARRFQQTGQADLPGIDSLIRFEAELATSTRELAEGLLARGIDETELLYQAETAMLAAADSLSTGKYDMATRQERDALKFLIEGRNRLEIGILKNRDRALLAQLRLFDRLQRQKLRRPKSDEEEAREVAERLEELAGREEYIEQALAGMAGQPTEQSMPKEERHGVRSLQELEDQQLDVAVESREIEKLLGRLKGITDLSKERMAAAAKTAEAAAEALTQQETKTARESAQSAGTQFRELAQQVQALLAEEQAERIAAAQRIAAELAQQQREFVDRLATGGTTLPGLEQQAEQIAERSQTLNDVLGAGSRAADPQEEPAAKKIGAMVGSLKLGELAERLKELPGQVGAGRLEDAKTTAADGADRMDAAAENLAVLLRSIIAPKADELAQLESKIVAMEQGLEQLDTPSEITRWHVRAGELLDELGEAGVSDELRDRFLEEMKKGGWSPDRSVGRWGWPRLERGNYQAPGPYRVLITQLLDDVRGRIQELMLGDLAFSPDEPIPPQYQELVDRYQQVLAAEGKGRVQQANGTTPPGLPAGEGD